MKQLVILVLALAIFGAFAPTASGLDREVTVAAAGDIAKCGGSGDEKTASLLQTLNPDRVVTLGDNVYPDGTISEFLTCYDPSWGAFKWKTKPSPGNHEYHTLHALGYKKYFRLRGDPWYAWNLRGWRFYSLNSEERIEEQVDWLRQDMQDHPRDCYLAYWHKPRYSDGRHGDEPAIEPLWSVFASHGGDIALAGHDHNYQRFARIDGVREFVVGTGGAALTPIHGDRALVSNDQTRGLLLLTLRAGGYDWSFEPVPGGTFHDSGRRNCVNDAPSPFSLPRAR
jgi:acid phosphatase type 7